MTSFMQSYPPLLNFLTSSKPIRWRLVMGINNPLSVAEGTFYTTLAHLDFRGMIWGESLILNIGQHHSVYEGDISNILCGKLEPNPTSDFKRHKLKKAASGITGGIGEVLLSLFFQHVLELSDCELSHIEATSKMKS
ncbi:MAG: hypothetical protein ACXVP5_07790, partial [Tumebacillaceae bacterium]